MRNLRNVRLAEVQLQNELPLTATAWDTSADATVCTFGPTESNPVIELRRKRQEACFAEPVGADVFECIASWDAPCPLPDLPCDRVLSLHYFADNLTACLVLEGGDIIIVREEPLPGEDKIEILGSVDVGITAAAWSPDEELLALTTRANTFLYMTREFENVAEITFTQEDLKASQHVSVGWGKKETQFQGKRAKALRDPTVPEKVDEGKLSPNDDGRTTITWRGDGAYVAVNSTEADTRRAIRVYSREGTLDSVSEPVDGLEGALSWRPYGNLIAGIQRTEERVDVVFFERNGLRHGQFSLRLTEEDRSSWASDIHLNWNIDSMVLAVQFKDRVQFWTMGNYHYYLKQEIPIVVDYQRPFTFKWHQEKALRFVAGASESILDAEFVFNVSHGSTTTPGDVGAVGVIDGKTLKLTPLRLSGVPPPMAHNELELDSNILDVAFSKSGTRIAVLMKDRFSVFLWSLKTRPVVAPILESSYPLSDAPGRTPRKIAFVNENEVYILQSNGPANSSIEQTTLENRETKVVYQAAESEQLVSIFSDLENQTIWLSHTSQHGQPITYSTISSADGFEAIPYSQSPSVDTFWAQAAQISEDERLLISMAKTGALYANKTLLAKNCTSFLVTEAHILFTTSQHLLKFVHLTRPEDMEVPPDTPETDERCRSIERGSRLVSVIPTVFAVVLQAPRGNIETIYPRALVLAGIRSFIDRKNYRSAFLTCRSQMVDMNIIHDYAPEQFMESVILFIDQVKRVDFIDEFLSRLSEEDVSETLYKDTLKTPKDSTTAPTLEPTKPAAKGTKVNRICDAFLAALEKRVDTNLHNLVTAHVCKSPPDLEAGLQLVARLRDESAEQAEDAIEHMCFLSDANRLYDNALGLYDLELTLLVAQQAQRDPREYLPFLRKLQQMPELRRKFEIDNYLGRSAKALKHLHALEAHDELKAYSIKHVLYKDAIDLYKYQQEQLREMTNLYADYLYDQSKYKESGIAYESLSFYNDAYKCYQRAHLWRESLYCAMMVPLPEEELKAHALELATTLTEETRDYISAAHIHAEHLHDIPVAARLLCRGSRFADASRILALNGKQGMISEIVDSGLADSMGSMTDLLADFRSQLSAQVPRIRELRVRRVADPLAYFGGESTMAGDMGVDIPDNVSLAPTDASTLAGRSMFTRYTGNTGKTGKTNFSRQTSKTRRKEERKRASGKKGTVYEEEYLVNSVRRLIERVNSTVHEVETLVDALLRRGMRERAAAVEKAMQEVLKLCVEARQDVFDSAAPQGTDQQAEGQNAEQHYMSAGDRAVSESVAATLGVKEAPAVKELKQSALLN
ncbi:IKI3 family-domain-containing protein [Aspergillus avenaceus]|uniref:Elongator complex protein 1 n=1 Tax=Aspergillus avenaceus TaxID=36643 RepID=A0A5N6TUQ1_ASPAV|nr:IKI3 family-domain-containing protein [Aspergillus avenaceus]